LFDLQWGHTAVRAVEAWNAGVTGAGVRVCVLDTGFDMNHPDLVDNINQELSIDFTGDSPNGRPDYLALYPNIFSHGSHVAGTIAASDSKFPLVLKPGSIVSRPISTHRVNTFDLDCYTHFRWLWDDWSGSRRGACFVSLPERTTNHPACACLQPQLTLCFALASFSLLHRIKVLSELLGGGGRTSWILEGLYYAGDMYVK
jgi:subtilisin family serine protease